MGEVFLARNDGSAETLVVKRILPHLTQNPRFLRLFLDETRIASRLVHPNIARIHELGEADGTWFVAMEHVDGIDLRELLKRTREQGHHIPLEIGVFIAVEIARGLHYAHQATDAQGRSLHIVHRDISPHNVLLGRDGTVKVIDFGVARAANKSIHTATGVLKGKFPYMAPEQARAQPVDARTDVFALGIVLWEMLCARYLFRGKTDAATLKQVRAAEVPTPSGLRDDIPAALDAVMLKALKKDPVLRYQSAEAFREALANALANLPIANLAKWLKNYDDVPGMDESLDEPESSELSSDETVLESHERPTLAESPRQLTRAERAASASTSSSEKSLEEVRALLAHVSGRPTNLAPQATSFVGRVAELADLHQLFRQGARLVTLLGPGGTGKTRLSQQFASQLVTHFQGADEKGQRRGGVWFCDLTEAKTRDELINVVARALEVPIIAGDAVAQLTHAIAARGELLLVMDNFEQLVTLAPDTVAAWLKGAPNARFVVSSRELLRVAEETVFEVPPLRTPKDNKDARTAEAVQLFIERSRSARPGWEPSEQELHAIAEVCRQLDGMPLAIELAAGRMGVLTPSQLASRLPQRFDVLVTRGVSDRQATLRGAIDGSWATLSAREQQVLAQLAVFRGGFLADAAQAVVGQADVLETLFALRSKSLVRVYFPSGDENRPRYGLFETIREYAWEKLGELRAAGPALARHADWYLTTGAELASKAESRKSAIDALEQERENLQAVYDRAIDADDGASNALRAMVALDPLLTLRGPFSTHLKNLDALVLRLGTEPVLLLAALEMRSRARLARGRSDDARVDLQAARDLADSLHDERAQGRVAFLMAVALQQQGGGPDAQTLLEEALARLTATGDTRMQGRAYSSLAGLQHDLGNEQLALELYNRALEIHRAAGDRRYEGVTLTNLGVVQHGAGLLKAARANFMAAMSIHRELGNRRSEGISQLNLGELAAELDLPGQALAHYQNALELLQEVGAKRFVGHALVSLASLHQQYGEYDDAVKRLGPALEALREVGDQRYLGLALAIQAAVSALQGQVTDAEDEMVEAARVLNAVGEEAFLDALELYRAHLELGHVLQTRSEHQARVLEQRIRKRVARLSEPGADNRSRADRSEYVRAALRSLRGAMSDSGRAL